MMFAGKTRDVFVLVALVGLVGWTGCSTPEKPTELTELERILQEEGANEVKDRPGARKYYERSRDFREKALDALEDQRDVELARHYAIRGKLAYRTAEAVARTLEAKKRHEKIKAKSKKIDPKITRLIKKRDSLRGANQRLQRRIQEAQTARAERRRAEMESSASSGGTKMEAQEKLESALDAKQRALDAKANQYAKGEFNRAENELQSARSMMESGSFDDVIASADSAQQLFEKAAGKAKEQNPERRMQALREQLTSEFGANRTESVSRGVRVSMPGLFDEGSAAVLGSKRGELEKLASLAKEYSAFKIQIDGYTSKGNPTDNLATSQLRAKNVRDYFKSQGVSTERMSTDGKGQSNRRYSSPAKNERVEVTFRRGS